MPAAGTQPAANQPQTVTIPLEQLQTFTSIQARLAQIEAEQRSRESGGPAGAGGDLAKKGEVENALNLLRQQSEQQLANERAARAAVEERAKRYALDGEVSRVLASQPLVPGGAEQLTQLWRIEFIVEPQGDSFAVRTPTFQSVGDFVAAQLAPARVRSLRPGPEPGRRHRRRIAGRPGRARRRRPTRRPRRSSAQDLREAVILTMKEWPERRRTAGRPRRRRLDRSRGPAG